MQHNDYLLHNNVALIIPPHILFQFVLCPFQFYFTFYANVSQVVFSIRFNE